jgi:hypothetical protein
MGRATHATQAMAARTGGLDFENERNARQRRTSWPTAARDVRERTISFIFGKGLAVEVGLSRGGEKQRVAVRAGVNSGLPALA